jgi:hypothetical protein
VDPLQQEEGVGSWPEQHQPAGLIPGEIAHTPVENGMEIPAVSVQQLRAGIAKEGACPLGTIVQPEVDADMSQAAVSRVTIDRKLVGEAA